MIVMLHYSVNIMINMTREEAKKLLPFIQAFSEGKTIQSKCITDDIPLWWNDNNPTFDVDTFDYRIKPEPKYRPFANAQECLEEMKKHQPFGWVKDKNKDSVLMNIQALFDEMLTTTDGVYFRGINLINGWHGFEEAVKEYTFADGTPFGIIEEE